MSFYLTLPSDSSLDFFPENKISHFTTRLPSSINLTGEWEVGLTEFIYPRTWHTLNHTNNTIGIDFGDGKVSVRRIQEGYYGSIPEILKVINADENASKVLFNFNPATKRVRIKMRKNIKVILYEGLAQILGFKPGEIAASNDSDKIVFSSYVADPCAEFRVLMLYSDIVEPQVVGNLFAPLLRIINVTGQDGDVICVQYDRPHYLPVSRKQFDTIQIHIRSHTGNLTPFERGRSYVKLHFRQKHL